MKVSFIINDTRYNLFWEIFSGNFIYLPGTLPYMSPRYCTITNYDIYRIRCSSILLSGFQSNVEVSQTHNMRQLNPTKWKIRENGPSPLRVDLSTLRTVDLRTDNPSLWTGSRGMVGEVAARKSTAARRAWQVIVLPRELYRSGAHVCNKIQLSSVMTTVTKTSVAIPCRTASNIPFNNLRFIQIMLAVIYNHVGLRKEPLSATSLVKLAVGIPFGEGLLSFAKSLT